MADFDHFLLTRFSSVFARGRTDAGGLAALPAGVLLGAAHPSVAAQRDARFTWLVMFDDRCSDAFRGDVEALAGERVFTPIWTHERFWDDPFASHVAARNMSRTSSRRGWTATMR